MIVFSDRDLAKYVKKLPSGVLHGSTPTTSQRTIGAAQHAFGQLLDVGGGTGLYELVRYAHQDFRISRAIFLYIGRNPDFVDVAVSRRFVSRNSYRNAASVAQRC